MIKYACDWTGTVFNEAPVVWQTREVLPADAPVGWESVTVGAKVYVPDGKHMAPAVQKKYFIAFCKAIGITGEDLE